MDFSHNKYLALSLSAKLKHLHSLLTLHLHKASGTELESFLSYCMEDRSLPFPKKYFIAALNGEATERMRLIAGIETRLPTLSRHGIIERGDERETEPKLFPVKLILHNLRSAFNVGSLFRLADGFGVEKILLSGFTPKPAENQEIKKTAMGAEKTVAYQIFPELKEAIETLDQSEVLAIETTSEAIALEDQDFHFPCALVLGNESLGLEPEDLKHCSKAIKINMYGMKNSFNVAQAGACVLYEARKQWNLNA